MSNEVQIQIKKYGNRKLYDERKGAYITMLELSDIVAEGKSVRVIGDLDGRDLTIEALSRALYERIKSRRPGRGDPTPADLERLIAKVDRREEVEDETVADGQEVSARGKKK